MASNKGVVLIGIGVWVALLTLAFFSKFERQQKGKRNPSAYLLGFLALSAGVLAVALYMKVSKHSNDIGLSANVTDSPFMY